MKHTLKKKAAPLNATLRIVISKDIISFMYDLYHLSLLLLELPHRLHPEGNVQHELNVFYFFSVMFIPLSSEVTANGIVMGVGTIPL